MPKVDFNCVDVKTGAVALNPVDWKHTTLVPETAGRALGSDFAGLVRKVGDRVAGWVHGGNVSKPQDGAFAQYIVAKDALIIKIPEGVSFTDAATFGVGVSTVVTPCSSRHFEMVRMLGADAVFDYREPKVGSVIHKLTRDALYHAFDCISTRESAKICADALSENVASKTPIYSALLYCEFPRTDVRVVVTVAQIIFGKSFTIPELGREHFPADIGDYEFGRQFWTLTRTLLAKGKIRAHPTDVRGGDPEGVLEGLEELRQAQVAGKKLVYELS
ncbi:hypothetical protein PspLS_11653 [Pyricularia sp. CBS 133598]|nr:hypothetical protein PspLS_11653 [Pyricularia sp. CBS 133598]